LLYCKIGIPKKQGAAVKNHRTYGENALRAQNQELY